MEWKKLTLCINNGAAELACNMLEELGISGVEIEDKLQISEEDRKKMFIDILPELHDDGKTRINFYIDETEDENAVIEKVKEGLKELSDFVDVSDAEFSVSHTKESDWIDNWKQYFKPFRVDENIIIKPTWEELTEKAPDDTVIEIDPGTAFGTGAHETTKLCIINLKKYMKKGARVVDLGCGSGILSIAARKLGASYVLGTDIDPIAVEVSTENAKQNRMESAFSMSGPGVTPDDDVRVLTACDKGCGFYLTDVLSDEMSRKLIGSDYDIVVANILADVIVPLAGVAGEFMKDNAVFISSGIINTKADEVYRALIDNNFEIVETTRMNDWVSYVARKKQQKQEEA